MSSRIRIVGGSEWLEKRSRLVSLGVQSPSVTTEVKTVGSVHPTVP